MSRSISLMLTLTWGTDILFYELRPETGERIWKTPFDYVSFLVVFFFNIFSGDPHFDALIIGL